MKLNFKDLKKQTFSVDAEPSETIADVKQKIATEKGFDAAAIKLIWSGKILADTSAMSTYDIKPTDHIVCMVSKPKAAPVASRAPSTPAPATTQTPSAPAPAAQTSTTAAPATPSPAPATTVASERQFNDPSAMMLGPERQAAIANMEAMGFERAQCERAFRAAFYNADRAVEYLLNGIPASAEQNLNQQRAPQASPQPSAPVTSNPEGDEPVNLFEAAAAANQPGGASLAAGGGSAGSGGGNPASGLDFLRDNPTFRNLRTAVQQNPQMLETVLQQLANSNPQLAQHIAAHPEAFMGLLMEGEGEDADIPLPPGAQSVSVTEAERDAIERLCRLGFDRDSVIQAYFACDKNEELAANFLFDTVDNDEGDA